MSIWLEKALGGMGNKSADRKNRAIIDYLQNEASEIIARYKEMPAPLSVEIPMRIWTLWWQGEENLPAIPRACIRKMRELQGFEVTVLSKSNIADYIDLSDVSAFFEGKKALSVQSLSDLIRYRLLYQYGGVWLDSTIAIINPELFLSEIRSKSFFSLRTGYSFPDTITRGCINESFLASVPQNPFFSFLNDCSVNHILLHQTEIIDYFWNRYFIMLGYKSLEWFRNQIDGLEPSNPEWSWLSENAFAEFNESKWESITKYNSVQKMNWRLSSEFEDSSSVTSTFWKEYTKDH